MLPFERHLRGEEDKPLPPSKPRKQYKRNMDGKVSKAEGKRKRTQSETEMDSSEVIHISGNNEIATPSTNPVVTCMSMQQSVFIVCMKNDHCIFSTSRPRRGQRLPVRVRQEHTVIPLHGPLTGSTRSVLSQIEWPTTSLQV